MFSSRANGLILRVYKQLHEFWLNVNTPHVCNVLLKFILVNQQFFPLSWSGVLNIPKPTYAALYNGMKVSLFSFWYTENNGSNISHESFSWMFGFVTEMLLVF